MSSRPAAWKAFWHRLVHLLTLKPKPAGKGICSKSCPAFNLLSSWDLCPLLSHVGLAFLLFHQRHPVGLTAASRASHPGDEIRNPCFPTLTSRQVLNSWETEENWAQQTLEGICQISPKNRSQTGLSPGNHWTRPHSNNPLSSRVAHLVDFACQWPDQ